MEQYHEDGQLQTVELGTSAGGSLDPSMGMSWAKEDFSRTQRALRSGSTPVSSPPLPSPSLVFGRSTVTFAVGA